HFISVFKKFGQYSTYLKFLFDMKKNKDKAHSLSFENGMGEFTNALRENLKDNIQVNTKVDDISDMHNTIICTEAYNASSLLTKSHPKIAEYLQQIPYIDLQTTTFFTHDEIKDLQESFGVVFSP